MSKHEAALRAIVKYVQEFRPETADGLRAQLRLVEEIAQEALEL